MKTGCRIVVASLLAALSYVSFVGADAPAAVVGSSKTPARADAKSLGFTGTLLIQLRVRNLDRAIDFYANVLGFELSHRNDDLAWAKVLPPEGRVVIGLGAGSEVKGSGTLSLNFSVRDIAETRTSLEARGVVFKGETITIEGVVKLADFEDPDGNRIRLAQSLDPNVD